MNKKICYFCQVTYLQSTNKNLTKDPNKDSFILVKMSDLSENVEKYLLKINQPEVFGPGTWRSLHVLGLDANTYAKKMQYIHTVELILSTTPCLEPCRKDILEYLQKNPLTRYWNIIENGEDVGMFYWSIDCHNWVNRKLNKLEVPRDIAYQFYKYPEKFVCKEGCNEKTSPIETSTRIVEPKKSSGFLPF